MAPYKLSYYYYYYYGRDVRRGMIVARLNGSRMGVEGGRIAVGSCCNRRLIAKSEARLAAV